MRRHSWANGKKCHFDLWCCGWWRPSAIWAISGAITLSSLHQSGNCKQVERSKALLEWFVRIGRSLSLDCWLLTQRSISLREIQRGTKGWGSPRLVIANDPKVSEQIVQDAILEWELDPSALAHQALNQWLRDCSRSIRNWYENCLWKYHGLNVSWDYGANGYKT